MSTELLDPAQQLEIDRTLGNFSYEVKHQYDAGVGLSHDTIDYIANVKGEPDWIREFRHKALDTFLSKPLPTHWASKDLARRMRSAAAANWPAAINVTACSAAFIAS